MPSQVRIIVRTRPTDYVTDSFSVKSDTLIHVTRPPGVLSQSNTSRFQRGANSPRSNRNNASSSRMTNTGNHDTTSVGNRSTTNASDHLFYTVDGVLHNASQESVYNVAVSDLTEAALLGMNCTLLCYGQSGAGKTYTLFGGETYPTRGCVPRALQSLFEAMHASTEREYKASLTFVEVYGEQVYDLLGKGPTAAMALAGNANANANAARAVVAIDGNGAVLLRGVEERPCGSEAEALAAVFTGLQHRLGGPNPLNPRSSRSHAVLTLNIVSRSLVDSDALTHKARLHFVDLAGSERPHADDASQHEAQMVNRSLAMLEQVILALASSRSRHVPYRQSKLTMLLKDSIGGTSKTTLIANVWPEERHTEATLATMNFAKRMMRVESSPAVQASLDPTAQIKMLQKQVVSLRSELRMQDQLAGRETIPSAPLDSDEIAAARERVLAYVDGSASQVHVESMREMHACFHAFRGLLSDRDGRMRELERQLQAPSRPASAAGGSGRSNTRRTHQRNSPQSPSMQNADARELLPQQQNRFVASVADAAAGVGVGRTEQPSSALRDMFPQHRLSVARASEAYGAVTGVGGGHPSSHAAPTNAGGMNASLSQAGAGHGMGGPYGAANPPLALTGAAPSGMHSPMGVGASTMPYAGGGAAEGAMERPLPPIPAPERPASGVRAEPSMTSPPLMAHTAPNGGAPRPLWRAEGAARDRRAAFEAYKRTAVGAAQLSAIAEAQRLVAAKGEAAARMQRRAREMRAEMDRAAQGGSKGATLRATNAGASAEATGPHSASSSSAASGGGEMAAIPPTERLARLRHTSSAATRALTERGILLKQLHRKREAFMSNFDYWFRSGQQQQAQPQQTAPSSFLPPSAVHMGGAAQAMQQPYPKQDMRFMDGAERFEAMEMQRLLREDPEGATYYAAQRLVRRGQRSPTAL